MENLPAKQLQHMKQNLRDRLVIKMAKTKLITLAIDQCKKPNIQELKKHLKGMPALLFTKDDPFLLYSTLKKSKSRYLELATISMMNQARIELGLLEMK